MAVVIMFVKLLLLFQLGLSDRVRLGETRRSASEKTCVVNLFFFSCLVEDHLDHSEHNRTKNGMTGVNSGPGRK